MQTQIARKQSPTTGEAARKLVELALRVRSMCAANGSQPRNHSLTATGPWGEPTEIEFIDRQPYGFVFTEGQQATFRVPTAHRFIIEQVNVSWWGDGGALSMHLVTNAPRVYRCVEVAYFPEHSASEAASGVTLTPLALTGLSANTFMFSDRKVHNSSTVPSDACLQIWGYLEPSDRPNELLYGETSTMPRSGVQANLNLTTH